MKENRSVIIVGGAGGIGSDVCRRLAAEGYVVVVVDLNLDAANEVLASLPGRSHRASRLDITNPQEVDECFDAIEADRPAAVLVVASGGMLPETAHLPNIATMSTSQWERTIALNISGVFYCIRKFAQVRLANPLQHTRIISFSSGSGQIAGTPTDIAYISAKAAVIGFTRQVSLDLAPAGITVNNIAPGPIATPTFNRMVSPEDKVALAGITVLNRMGTPSEISVGVSFLASRDASFITGTTLDINGGGHMH